MLKYSYIVYKKRRHVHISDNNNNNKSLLIVKDDAVWRLVLVDWWMFSNIMASLINLQTNFASCINAGLIKSLILLKWYIFIKGISYSFLNKLYWGHWKRKCTSSSTFVGTEFTKSLISWYFCCTIYTSFYRQRMCTDS